MTARTIFITGGAGFIGSNLALHLKCRHPGDRVIAFDNLRRRGSELNLPRLRDAGVEFVHGDVRAEADLQAVDARIDALIECSADPSVLAGYDGQGRYVVETNLMGCVNCLELARANHAIFVFLSTSRVYPMAALRNLRYEVVGRRFQLASDQSVAGANQRGISEEFPLSGARTLYGATKLASELLIAEYVEMYGLPAVVNRCGVLSGPWQMGKAEQGVFAHWVAAHVFRKPLSYIGFGGHGYQVRDVLHSQDLAELIELQLSGRYQLTGDVFNVGGGLSNSLSLSELTDLCRHVTGIELDVKAEAENRPGDVPIYVTDNTKVERLFGWGPRRDVREIVGDLYNWMTGQADLVRSVLS